MRAVVGTLLIALSLQTSSTLADGVAALNDGDSERAVTLLERAAAAEPASRLTLLHLANAQAANRQPDAASATLKQVLRLNPDDTLALWNLGVLPGSDGIGYLRRLIEVDSRYPNVLTALAAIQTMRARMQYTSAKRASNVRAEDQGWIAETAVRAALRAAAGSALDEAQAASERARAVDSTAFEPLVFIGLALRIKAEIADDAETSKRYIDQADQLTSQSMTLRRQQPPPPAPGRLDPNVPPPPLPIAFSLPPSIPWRFSTRRQVGSSRYCAAVDIASARWP
jgi:tetratricopeptide (TPR) repeat protein